MRNGPSLSIIIPAYCQERTILQDVKNLEKTLNKIVKEFEVIIVIDGAVDKTEQIVKRIENKKIQALSYPKNMGKGYAIRKGVLIAKGDIIGFKDAGLDIDPKSISILLQEMKINDADIAIGSKLHPESKVKYPAIRKGLSWGYRNLSKLLFGLNIRDTQAGLKLYEKNVAKRIFKLSRINDYAFDIETLVLANLLGYKKVYEAPINLNFKKNTITNFNFFFVAFKMFIDTLIVFTRVKLGLYKVGK